MKKLLPLFLIICILLCGCNRMNPEIPSSTQAPTEEVIPETQVSTQPAQETTDEITYSQQPMFAVALPFSEKSIQDEKSSFIYQDIHLFCQEQEIADRIIVDYLNRQDAHLKKAEASTNTSYQILYQPTRMDSCVMSLYGQNVIHQGKNHPVIECQALNYSIITGEVLTLGSILRDGQAHEKLRDALLFTAESTAEEYQLYGDYPHIIADRFRKNPSFDEDWFFTTTGLAFFFDPYEIAPYTSGIVILEIPFDRLTEIVADAFFPAEEDLFGGRLHASSLDDIHLNSYTQIAEVNITGYSSGIMLYTDGLLRDVRIDIVADNQDEIGGSVFAASTLSPGDGIMLMFDSSIEKPILKITYRDGLSFVTNELFFDKNGSFVLA